jgi:N-acetylglucosamine repressor
MERQMLDLTVNEVKIIHAIFLKQNATRIGIAKELGLSLLNVLSVLNKLESKKYIRKAGTLKSKSGRPSYTYVLEEEKFHSLGILVDVDTIRIVAIDAARNVLFKKSYPLEIDFHASDFVNRLLEAVAERVLEVKTDFDSQGKTITAICVALLGMVDTARGMWLLGLQLGGIKNVNFAEQLECKVGIPTFIDDTSRSLTFYEKIEGCGSEYDDFILLSLGRGVGSGIVIDGRLYEGFHGIAGEIGHIPHGNNNYRCSCGNIGCLEAIVSTTGITRVFHDRLKEGVVSPLQRLVEKVDASLTLEDIKKAAENGDRFSIATLFELGQFIGDACATIIKLFNPQRIIISGYSAILKEFFAEAVDQRVKHNVILEMLTDYKTIFADYELSHEANGAALMAMNRYWTSGFLKPIK